MNTSIKLFYYNLKTAFYKIATDRTTVSDLCYILDNDRNYVILLLSVLNNRMDVVFSGLKKFINISLLQNDVVAISSYPTTYIGKFVKINNTNEIEKLFKWIMDDNYYVKKLTIGDSRPLWYYSHQYTKKKDEFFDDILKEYNFK